MSSRRLKRPLATSQLWGCSATARSRTIAFTYTRACLHWFLEACLTHQNEITPCRLTLLKSKSFRRRRSVLAARGSHRCNERAAEALSQLEDQQTSRLGHRHLGRNPRRSHAPGTTSPGSQQGGTNDRVRGRHSQ